MSRVRKYRPDVRLQDLLRRPGGITIDEALANAERGLQTLRTQCIDAVDTKIDEIAVQSVAEQYDPRSIYALADEIFALAGTFSLNEVSRAAYSLCTLLTSEKGARNVEAVRVHVEALRLLRDPAVVNDSLAAGRVLEGLVKVSRRFTEADEAKAPSR